MKPTQALVRDLFTYDPFTGILRNKTNRSPRARAGEEAGSLDPNGYLRVTINYKNYWVHRIIWLWVYGEWPNIVDHIEGNKADNRLHMLRDIDHPESDRNKGIPCNNTSGHIGVYWYKANKKWQAYIRANGNNTHLGYFTDIEDAIKARKLAELEHGYHPNHGRAAA